VRPGTFVCEFSASPFATRTRGKSTVARRGGRRQDAATEGFIAFGIGRGKNPIHTVEYSIRRSCAIWYCATQSLYDRILPVQDRASCLPESSRRALVADAREIRQYQMHPSSPPEKRDGHPVRRASRFFAGRHEYFYVSHLGKLPRGHPMNLQAEFFLDMLHRPCFRGVQSTVPC
jgi:hypothetical protein